MRYNDYNEQVGVAVEDIFDMIDRRTDNIDISTMIDESIDRIIEERAPRARALDMLNNIVGLQDEVVFTNRLQKNPYSGIHNADLLYGTVHSMQFFSAMVVLKLRIIRGHPYDEELDDDGYFNIMSKNVTVVSREVDLERNENLGLEAFAREEQEPFDPNQI